MQYSRIAGAGFRTFASLVLFLVVAAPHTWSTEPPIPADAELSAQGVGTAARTDASEAVILTNAIVPGAAPTVENFKLASDYSAKNGGRAVLVLVDGKTVFEKYDNGFGPETATHLHSATKGFWGPVIAREWTKYGQWLLQDGEWNGKQIVRKDLLHELLKPSDANPGHGLALWLNQSGG